MAIINKTGITDGSTIQAEHVTRAIDALSGGSTDSIVATGSFTGSFTGDGSGLTGIVSSSYAVTASYADNALSAINTPNAVITASNTGNDDTIEFLKGGGGAFSVTVNNVVSSSYALTASYAENAGDGVGFPYTGSAIISGSLSITGTSTFTTNNVNIGSGKLTIIADSDSSINFEQAGRVTGTGLIIPLFEPASPQIGSMYFDYTGPTLLIYDGSEWRFVTLT
jgi:hypothetical protein